MTADSGEIASREIFGIFGALLLHGRGVGSESASFLFAIHSSLPAYKDRSHQNPDERDFVGGSH